MQVRDEYHKRIGVEYSHLISGEEKGKENWHGQWYQEEVEELGRLTCHLRNNQTTLEKWEGGGGEEGGDDHYYYQTTASNIFFSGTILIIIMTVDTTVESLNEETPLGCT